MIANPIHLNPHDRHNDVIINVDAVARGFRGDIQSASKAEIRLNDLGTPRSFLGIQFEFHADGSISNSPASVHSEGSVRLLRGGMPAEEHTHEFKACPELPSR